MKENRQLAEKKDFLSTGNAKIRVFETVAVVSLELKEMEPWFFHQGMTKHRQVEQNKIVKIASVEVDL